MLTTRGVFSPSRFGELRAMAYSLYQLTTTEDGQTEAKGTPMHGLLEQDLRTSASFCDSIVRPMPPPDCNVSKCLDNYVQTGHDAFPQHAEASP